MYICIYGIISLVREDHINSFTGVNNNFSNLWVSNSIGMLMVITWVGVILMEPTEFSLALPNCSGSCGDVKIPYPSLWHKWRLLPENIFYQLWHLNQILETSLLQNVSIHGEMDILMSNYIDCYKHTTTRVCLWKTIWNYFSMSPAFSNIFFVKNKIFVKFCEMFYQRKFEKTFIEIKLKKKNTHTHTK